MSKAFRCLAGPLGLVAGLSLILLGSCQGDDPTSPPKDDRPVSVVTPLPTPIVSPAPPSDMPGVPPPPRDLPGGSKPPSGAGSGITIEIHSTSFSPQTAFVEAGQEIRWHNADTVAHGAKSDTPGLFDTGSIAPDETSSPIALSETGSVSYRCPLHSAKTGTLKVTDSANVR